MLHILIACLLFRLQDPSDDPAPLVIGGAVAGRVSDDDPEVHTPLLDADHAQVPTLGRLFSLRVEESGPYTIELRSWFFDAYLVLRDEAGEVLGEDDDGLLENHARLVCTLEAGKTLLVEACALHGRRGPFELSVRAGAVPELTPETREDALRRDAERWILAVEKELGPSRALAFTENEVGAQLARSGDYGAARPHLERAVELYRQCLGPEHPDTAASLSNLGVALWQQKEPSAALPLLERALPILERALGPDDPGLATVLDSMGGVLSDLEERDAARPYLERALELRERVLGPDHPDTALSQNNLASLLWKQGDYAGARPLHERALRTRERVFGPDHFATLQSLGNLAILLREQGQYSAARGLLERVVATQERTLGKADRRTLASKLDLGTVLNLQGEYGLSRGLLEDLGREASVLGLEQPYLANLAGTLSAQGEHAGARPLLERALALREELFGPDDPGLAQDLINFANSYVATGDYAIARPLYERALAIVERVLGPGHPVTATALSNMAHLLSEQGDPTAARPLCERALAIRERTCGPEHPATAESLNNLGSLLSALGEPSTVVRSLLERAVAIQERALGLDDPTLATYLSNLGLLLGQQGDPAGSRRLHERALAIREKVLGPRHPDTATSQNNLAMLLRSEGAYDEAGRLIERARATYESTFGPVHPGTVVTEINLGFLLIDQGRTKEGLSLEMRALAASLAHAERTLWSLSERERLAFLRSSRLNLDLCLSAECLLGALDDVEAEVFDLSLAVRGLVSRSLLASREQLLRRQGDEASRLLEELREVQARVSRLLYEPGGVGGGSSGEESAESALRGLRERRNEIEVRLQRLAGASEEATVSARDLRESLPRGTAFLDFLVHRVYTPARREGEVVIQGSWSPDRLACWILRPDAELVRIDLGPVAPIEASAQGWLRAVATGPEGLDSRGISVSGEGPSPAVRGSDLRALLWDPLAAALEGAERVFVRPDSFLGGVPLDVIPLADGRYLIEEKDFVYVQTPLDLVARRSRESTDTPSLLTVGGVDFTKRAQAEIESAGAPGAAPGPGREVLRGSSSVWGELPSSEPEARAVQDLFSSSFPAARVLSLRADEPTEERLKRELPRHAIAHLATHGFFHPRGTVSMWDSMGGTDGARAEGGLAVRDDSLIGELPGFLTGLVCAGANTPTPEGREDGLLTAEEVLWLDLSKVELVVLSACETALGERRAGEGMIGLRRAFGLAGVRTVISTLWSVRDRSTQELMQAFYENLWTRRQGRAEALRAAKLAMLARNRVDGGRAQPSTWGPFVLSGEWR